MKIALGLLLAVSTLTAQNANDTSEAHVAVAKAVAGADYQNLFNFQCFGPGPGGTGQRTAAGAPRGQDGGQGGGQGRGQRAGGQKPPGPTVQIRRDSETV